MPLLGVTYTSGWRLRPTVTSSDRATGLCQALAELIEREGAACRQGIEGALEGVAAVRGGSLDRRLQRVEARLREVASRIELAGKAKAEMLAEIRSANATSATDAEPLIALIHRLAEQRVLGRTELCTALLDHLMASCQASRGYVMFYAPESSEAEVVCTAEFRGRNLALEEFQGSRTLLLEALQSGATIRLSDACRDERYSELESVRELQLRSVMVVPILLAGRSIGAVVLEDRSLAAAFSPDHAHWAETAAGIVACCLKQGRLIPGLPSRESRVFLDAGLAGSQVIGDDPRLRSLLAAVERVADLPIAVLIEGETGTGKELVARALHHTSSRRKGPFVAINCASIHGELAESELFGHERGAYTGAVGRHAGCFEQASGGTLFLDEVNELANSTQAKLLRVLESKEIKRIGGEKSIPIDVRVVAASSRSLRALSAEGRFQEPLLHRLNAIRLELPPLRERRGDIPALLEHFLAKYTSAYNRSVVVADGVLDVLQEYAFPGNIRELENIVRSMVALAREGAVLGVEDLPSEVRGAAPARVTFGHGAPPRWLSKPADTLAELRRHEALARKHFATERRRLVERAIAEEGGVSAAARKLKVNRVTLHKLRRNKP